MNRDVASGVGANRGRRPRRAPVGIRVWGAARPRGVYVRSVCQKSSGPSAIMSFGWGVAPDPALPAGLLATGSGRPFGYAHSDQWPDHRIGSPNMRDENCLRRQWALLRALAG